MRKILAWSAAGVLLSACGGSSDLDVVKAAKNGEARVVVAVIDSAMNPYHEFYYAGSDIYPTAGPSSVTPAVLEEIGVPPENVIELTRTGNISRDKETDADKWKKVRRGRPYWFKGTNLIGVSFSGEPYLIPSTNPEKNPHGVGTSASVLISNPDAVILFVETWDSLANDESHNYAFLHPAVDFISTSYGISIPNTGFPLPEASAFLGSFDAVVKMGKMHFSSGGNGPGLTPFRAGAGPWWSIGVSGIEEHDSEGKSILSGNFPDFVSDFTQDIPYCQDCERGIDTGVGGTSFSTPRAAGVASKVLLEARRALGHGGGIRIVDGKPIMAEGNGRAITTWDLRRALEEAAWVPGIGDQTPGADLGYPVNPAAPWLQVGWGDLSALPEKQVIAEAIAHLGFGTPTRVKPVDFCDFQTKIIEERILFWSTAAVDAADHPAAGEFVFCGSTLPPLPAGPTPIGEGVSPPVSVHCPDQAIHPEHPVTATACSAQ